MFVKLRGEPSWGNFVFPHLSSISCPIWETTRSPQISVGSAGTVEGWPGCKHAAVRLGRRYRRIKSLKLPSKKCEWNGCSDSASLPDFQEKGHLWVMEWVRASELTSEYFRNLFWAILQLLFSFSYCLQSSYGFEMYLIVVLNSIIKQKSGDFSDYDNNVCFF